MPKPPMWAVGERVVISWRGRQYAGVVVASGRVGALVETDQPYSGDERRLWRHDFEVFDRFDDGSAP